MLTAGMTLLRGSGLTITGFGFAFIHSVLRGIPTADLRQHDDRQQRGQHEPGDVAFAVGAMITAASSGPSELPKLPPTRNSDCARP